MKNGLTIILIMKRCHTRMKILMMILKIKRYKRRIIFINKQIKTTKNSLVIILSLNTMKISLSTILLTKLCHTRRKIIMTKLNTKRQKTTNNFYFQTKSTKTSLAVILILNLNIMRIETSNFMKFSY